MKLIFSTHWFRRQRLGVAQLETLRRSGADGVELFCARPSFDYHDRAQMADLAAWFAANDFPVHALHSPIYGDEKEGRSGEPPINIADPEPRQRLAALDEIQRALEFRERVPFRYLIQHLGPPRVDSNQRFADRALTSLERIRLLAKQVGVTVLVENIPNGLGMPESLLAFLEASHLDDVGICFDSGHAQMRSELFGGGGALTAWEILTHRVRSTHLNDNHGSQDEHLWPGDGAVDWDALLPALALKRDQATWVLEVADKDTGDNLGVRIAACRKRFEALAGPPRA